MGWAVDPKGLYHSLSQYWDRYGKAIIIAENGFGMYDQLENGKIHDDYRIDYLASHIEEMKRAMYDGVNVIAYCAWGRLTLSAVHLLKWKNVMDLSMWIWIMKEKVVVIGSKR